MISKLLGSPREQKHEGVYLYRAEEGFVNLDSARQSTIEACGPNDEAIVKTMAEEEDRLGKAAASPNSLNLTERGKRPLCKSSTHRGPNGHHKTDI